MNSVFVKLCCTLIILITFAAPALQAQDGGKSTLGQDTLQDAYIIGGCGLAGGILGLSTLSFVDEPSEHTKNILMGAAIGIVAGVVVVAYNQANKTQGIMVTDLNKKGLDAKNFSSMERLATAAEVSNTRAVAMKRDPIQFSVNLSF